MTQLWIQSEFWTSIQKFNQKLNQCYKKQSFTAQPNYCFWNAVLIQTTSALIDSRFVYAQNNIDHNFYHWIFCCLFAVRLFGNRHDKRREHGQTMTLRCMWKEVIIIRFRVLVVVSGYKWMHGIIALRFQVLVCHLYNGSTKESIIKHQYTT